VQSSELGGEEGKKKERHLQRMEGAGEDVNEFLQRIKELGDKRNREDDERARKLEADILAGREARRARRDGKSVTSSDLLFNY